MDLTGRNQLLYYKDLKRGTLELTATDATTRASLLRGKPIRLADLFEATDGEPDRFDEALAKARTIHRKALAHFEERGVRTLYLAVGMATWKSETSSATPQAPVLLCPIEVAPRSASQQDFNLRIEGDWEVNETLLHLLTTDFAVRIDGGELITALDLEAGFDPSALYNELRSRVSDVPSFAIRQRSVVGTFSYTKLPMVRDLQNNVEALAEHDLIAAIAGDESAREAIRELGARDYDPSEPDYTPPQDEFLVLDADASQNLAINAARYGEPLIIQGPPGTGKSQTIANLIASASAYGKTVLFVAEKRAAIDAVVKRLKVVGLGDLVMDVHGGATSKRELAQRLGASLTAIGQVPAVDLTELHSALESSRDELRGYVEALHEKRSPWGLSMWDVTERLLELPEEAETDLRFTVAQLKTLDAAAASQARKSLHEWGRLVRRLIDGTSPWAGIDVRSETDAAMVHDTLSSLASERIPEAWEVLDELLAETGLREPATVAGWEDVLELLGGLDETRQRMSPRGWDMPLGELSQDLAPAGRGPVRRLLAHVVNARYRSAKRRMREIWVGPRKATAPELLSLAVAANDQLERWRSLGGVGAPKMPRQLVQASAAYGAMLRALAALAAFFWRRDLRQTDPVELQGEVQQLLVDEQTLYRLPRIHELETWLSDHHLEPLLESVRRGLLDRADLPTIFEHAWLSCVRGRILATDPRLGTFEGELHDDYVEAFKEADEQHIETSASRVQRAAAEHSVASLNEHNAEAALVRAQAKRKRGHLPLRALYGEAPNVMSAIRPCWAMSPLVVSQVLPAAQIFDLVIFDEASQVMPADAVPALLRATQAVIAGDSRQLPPTSFFDTVELDADDDDHASLTSGFEAILDVAGTLLRPYWLTWHYRSHDERLIAFSNHSIYEGSLTTFPGTAGGECLTSHVVPHRHGEPVIPASNDHEVEKVVDLMIDHARQRPQQSLGVIAMGMHHASRIDLALRQRLSTADRDVEGFFDENRSERAFIKNLERVQGDERDAIILTIGYAKHPDGRMRYHFGPLNQEGGERRLNVAVTRARQRLTLVSSFSHTEMQASKCRSRGAKLLREYLRYVETGGAEIADRVATPLNAFELSVKDWLEALGIEVIPQYGSSGFRIDFAVPHPDFPGQMLLAIEADGASYHSSATARDRDRLRQAVLEQKGWHFHRIWSTDWFNDREREASRVLDAYADALGRYDEREEEPHRDDGGEGEETSWEYGSVDRGPRPPVVPGMKITEYTRRQILLVIEWIQSDTLLRTDDQIFDELMAYFGYARRGKLIVTAFEDAIAAYRKSDSQDR